MAVFKSMWALITQDPFILALISEGIVLDFILIPPKTFLYQQHLGAIQTAQITSEIASLLNKGVITLSTQERCLWISPIFTCDNKDGSSRLILNLKRLNAYIAHVHFKMESLTDVLHMITPEVWVASVDLCHAYYSIPVEPRSQPYFSFLWQCTYYQYSCLPNGYDQVHMLSTKILRKPFSYLRRQGHLSVVYMDDTYLQGNSFVSCQQNIYVTVTLLQDL